MADWFDRAQAYEERDRERALEAALSRARSDGPSRETCLTCDKPIPAERKAVGGVIRCVPCQSLFEKYEAQR
jgi:phage/conjugal plasmid C-4 type zinc finger TraR family protein